MILNNDDNIGRGAWNPTDENLMIKWLKCSNLDKYILSYFFLN